MRLERILLMSMASVLWTSSRSSAALTKNYSAGETKVVADVTTRSPSTDSTRRGIADVLECLTKRLYSGHRDGGGELCYDELFVSSIWKGFQTEEIEGVSDLGKSKKHRLDLQNLMFGVIVKLILFLPYLAILTGKAISLSLTSFLIIALVSFYKTQWN